MKKPTLIFTLMFVCATLMFPLMNLAADDAAGTRDKKERDLSGLGAALDAGALRRQSIQIALTDGDARQKALNFLGSDQAHRDALASLQQCRGCHGGDPAAWVLDANRIAAVQPQGPWIGISVGPADGVLRSQLRLPEGSGVVVTQVVANGPAQQAGIEEHDVLLSVNGKPLATGEDLDKILQSATPGGPPLALTLLRRGQPVEKQVTPRKSDANEWLSTLLVHPQPQFRIGIQVSDPDETLKRQLNLTGGGVVITEVTGGKPADTAGVKSSDVLLSVNGNPVASQEELPARVQASGGSPVELELMRGGTRMKVSVTPVKEDAAVADPAANYLQLLTRQPDAMRELMLVHPQSIDADLRIEAMKALNNAATQVNPQNSPAERLRQITAQLEQMQREVTALQGELEKQQGVKPKQ